MENDDLNPGDKPPEKVGKIVARELIIAGDIRSRDEVSSIDIHGSVPLLGHTLSGGQEKASNNLMVNTDDTAQSNVSVLDGPVTGSNAEVTGGITSNAESEILLRIPNCDFQVASGFSTFPSYGNVFSGLAQNMSDPTRSDVNLAIARACSSNVRSNVVRDLNAQFENRERRQNLTAAGLQSTIHQGVAASGPSPKKTMLEVDSADGRCSAEASNVPSFKRGANAMQTLRSSARIQEKRQKTTRTLQHQTQAPAYQLPFWPPHLRRRRTNSCLASAPQASPSLPPAKPSSPVPPQATLVPAVPPAKPSSPVPPQATLVPAAHIKGPDLEPALLPMGRTCYLCKRDLAFTPEGLLLPRGLPPAAAVLPCGHAFHDQCLQAITPKDQAENPPCIPCAVGES